MDGVLGRGWILPWEQSLRRSGRFVYLTDNQGRSVPFVDVQPGERIYNPHEQVYLVCTEGGHYLLQTLDNIFFYFGEVPDDNTPAPIQRIENALGHFLHFTYTVDGTLTDISATGGVRVHLEYDNPLGRLTNVKRVVDNLAVETLVQYRYDDNGQLTEVINRNGDSMRRFSYADGVMVSHSNALGLSCNYRWETLNCQPRVVEHWTSDGEHFHFRYDFKNRTSWAVDVLGRELQVHYNEDHRVVASRDYGGERYAIEIDDTGNMPSSRQDAKGQRIRYDYDKAIRLTALVNENNAAYEFAYDASDRLIEEKRIDNLTRRFSYNLGGHLTRVEEIGYGERAERPQRSTEFERDVIGRLLAKVNQDARQDYGYDEGDRLLSIERFPTDMGKRLGLGAEKLEFAYDPLGRLIKATTPQGALAYEYDPLSNLTTLTLPTGQHLNHLYYGSGHLHQLNLDGLLISDMERDDLHREVYRSQGKLTSCFGYDAMGRKSWQFASTLPADKLSQIQNPGINTSLLVDHAYNPIHRRYEYDPAGELVRTLDKLRGEIKYEYEANGQLHSRDTGRLVDSEEFRYDAAANRLNFNTSQFDQVKDNRIKQWRDQEYTYDAWGNLIEKRVGLSKLQTFSYDCENRLVCAETMVNSQVHSVGTYRYDSLGRRIGKTSEIAGRTEHKHFLWQGLRMLREETPGQSSLYIYEPGGFAPLARVDQAEGEQEQKFYYFHTDQIGTPLEMTDVDGQIVWQATYKAWGEVETLAVNEVAQNLRFQGQYFDNETGLHYNTFRYYDPQVGRFITQDPIGLDGGTNLYKYVPSPTGWIDPWGWECWSTARKNYWKNTAAEEMSKPVSIYSPRNLAAMAGGQPPNITAKIRNLKTGKVSVKDLPYELHYTDVPQRVGGEGVHGSSNLTEVDRWQHAAVDKFRHAGSELLEVIKGVNSW